MEAVWLRSKQVKQYPHHHCFSLRISKKNFFTTNFVAEIGSGIQIIEPICANRVLGRYLNLVFPQIRIWQNDTEFLLQLEDAFLEGIEPMLFVLVCWVDAPVDLGIG
jgi:hypothetical protein